MKPTTGCPCGSGKSQVHCCGNHPKSKINLRLLVTWSFIILLGCGIGAIAFSRSRDDAPRPAAGLTPAPIQLFNRGASASFPSIINPGGAPVTLGSTSSRQVPAPLNITNPSPWQYDAVTDRHYDPNHAHWHSGPPPANPITSVLGSSSTSGSEVSAPPNIPNPQPWQYDPATYSHYDPNHGHWHSGPPPNEPNAAAVPLSGTEAPAPLNITNPSPWQYDAVTDRHYDPNHAHWHDGPPPPN